MKIFGYILLTLIVLLGLTFACLNADPVIISYYVGQSKMPLSLLLVIAFVFGSAGGLLASLLIVIKLKTELFRAHNRLKTVEKEVENLRTMPLQDAH